MYQHILVPTDGTALSMTAVQGAAELAKLTGGRMTLFYAQADLPPFHTAVGFTLSPGESDGEAIARQILDEARTAVLQQGVSEQAVVCRTRHGNQPWQLIVEEAESRGCDLIFMASHGRRGVDALLLGSETQKVLTHTRVPVLVYR